MNTATAILYDSIDDGTGVLGVAAVWFLPSLRSPPRPADIGCSRPPHVAIAEARMWAEGWAEGKSTPVRPATEHETRAYLARRAREREATRRQEDTARAAVSIAEVDGDVVRLYTAGRSLAGVVVRSSDGMIDVTPRDALIAGYLVERIPESLARNAAELAPAWWAETLARRVAA